MMMYLDDDDEKEEDIAKDDDDDNDIDKVEGVEVEEAYRVDGDTRPQDVRVRLALSSSSLS